MVLGGPQIFLRVKCFLADYPAAPAADQQKVLAETLPNGRLELFAGYGHLLPIHPYPWSTQPEDIRPKRP
jgi:hypothetical protein